MVYNCSQWLHSDGKKGVYQITTPNKAIGTFWCFVYDLMRKDKKIQHKQLISNWYKYWKEKNKNKIIIVVINSTHSVR